MGLPERLSCCPGVTAENPSGLQQSLELALRVAIPISPAL